MKISCTIGVHDSQDKSSHDFSHYDHPRTDHWPSLSFVFLEGCPFVLFIPSLSIIQIILSGIDTNKLYQMSLRLSFPSPSSLQGLVLTLNDPCLLLLSMMHVCGRGFLHPWHGKKDSVRGEIDNRRVCDFATRDQCALRASLLSIPYERMPTSCLDGKAQLDVGPHPLEGTRGSKFQLDSRCHGSFLNPLPSRNLDVNRPHQTLGHLQT